MCASLVPEQLNKLINHIPLTDSAVSKTIFAHKILDFTKCNNLLLRQDVTMTTQPNNDEGVEKAYYLGSPGEFCTVQTSDRLRTVRRLVFRLIDYLIFKSDSIWHASEAQGVIYAHHRRSGKNPFTRHSYNNSVVRNFYKSLPSK